MSGKAPLSYRMAPAHGEGQRHPDRLTDLPAFDRVDLEALVPGLRSLTAADILIPPKYAQRVPRTRDIGAVTVLADELGIAPSVVLGRAQHQTGDYGWGHKLERKFEWSVRVGA